jgi:hypothetical protein
MPRSPSIVPESLDRDVYLVLDDLGRLGRVWREMDEGTDRETVITDLIDGQFSDPVRVVSFNTAERWSRDVSEDLADEIARRCAMDGFDVPPSLESFVDRQGNEAVGTGRFRSGQHPGGGTGPGARTRRGVLACLEPQLLKLKNAVA